MPTIELKSPVELTALQWTGAESNQDLMDFIGSYSVTVDGNPNVTTAHGTVVVQATNWVMRDSFNALNVCSDEVFKKAFLDAQA